jgi:membrane associated rhomboid family serine protease
MPRYPSSPYTVQFGPGPVTPAVKALLIANVGMFVVTMLMPSLRFVLGLQPASVIGSFAVWQVVTYMFVHADVMHILFNMLTLWMFGVELERVWGTPFFSRYYAITGVGAGLCTVLVSLLPFGFAQQMYLAVTIGASGAIYALLLAYALYFPHRQIIFIIFPLPARVFVMILGGIALLFSISSQQGGVAHIAHLSGLVIGYLYLRGGSLRVHPLAELRYRYNKWRIDRMRRRFDVYSGGRRGDDIDRRIH